ncbi:nucleotidyltransferase domain-containing protein [Rossellomorea sp. NRS-1567]|uniref:nucleotidyltransferase domain-containing protein n=1 Tax=Rossellomorea sp. NRS-1567 TaxID=3233901 RepID=UPI003D2AE110
MVKVKKMTPKQRLNLSGIPNELLLIIDILKHDKLQENRFRVSSVDWEEFVRLVKHHRVYPQVYIKLVEYPITFIPDYVMKILKQLYQKNTFHMLHLSGAMVKVSQLFSDNSIKALFLKGPILATDIYGELSLRTCSDLDVLIHIDNLEEVDALLKYNGYKKDDYITTILSDWKWRHHHVTYYHPENKVKVEIHWRLNPGPSKEPGFKELWSSRREKPISSHNSLAYLGREHLLCFLLTHGARHGWSRLRWLEDVRLLLQQDIEWENVDGILREYQCTHLYKKTLLLCTELFSTSTHLETQRNFEDQQSVHLAQQTLYYLENKVNLHSTPLPVDIAEFHKKYLFLIKPFQQKVWFYLSLLHPYPEDLHTLYLPKKLHFLYFPLRPFLSVWRRTRKNALQ